MQTLTEEQVRKIDGDWWADQNEMMQMRLMDFRWLDEGISKVQQFADRFPKSSAFVFGTGPSLSGVTPEQWTALAGYFTIGVNGAPYMIQQARKATDIPKACLMTDMRKFTCAKMDTFADGFRKCKDAGGMSIMSMGAYQFPHHYTVPIFGNPHKDIRIGLPISLTGKVRFNRAVCPAVHLCLQTGFKNIYLIGVDHAPDYQGPIEDDTRRANEAFADYNEKWCKPRGVGLFECGEKTHVRSIPFKNLDEVLNASHDIQADTGPALGVGGTSKVGDNHARRGVAVPV